jgi:FixJ family two-component response regulator
MQDRLIAQGHRISIIFITGHPTDGARARAMKAGAVGFLNKPFGPDHLIGCIERTIPTLRHRALSQWDSNQKSALSSKMIFTNSVSSH